MQQRLNKLHLTLRDDLEAREDSALAPYAQRSRATAGREAPEAPDLLRTEYQRDRDRILHCTAFRRLEYKTQVYVTHEGDFFRTRLTHTLEVAQIATTLARGLGLNPELTEAIALAHDLGHTPFGHTGEAVLNELLGDDEGFEHNAQSLRLVELLEERYHDRPGLNLTWEVRAGIAAHSRATQRPEVARYNDAPQALLEAQLVDLADEIAYNHHDIDDAVGMGLLTLEDLREVTWLWDLWQAEWTKFPDDLAPEHRKGRALAALMDGMVFDVLQHVAGELARHGIDSPQAVRRHPTRLISFSPAMAPGQQELRAFLRQRVYRHPLTLRMQTKAGEFFRKLFIWFYEHPELLPLALQPRIEQWGLKRVLVDYLSSMTDRHCLETYVAHFEPTLRWSR